MAHTLAQSANQVSKWRARVAREWARNAYFSRYQGTSDNSIIQVLEDLTKNRGDSITFSFIRNLKNTATTGTATMMGNEESLLNYGHKIEVTKRRNAVLVPEMERIKTEFDLFTEAETALKTWLKTDTFNLIVQALCSTNVDGVTAYADCSAAERNAWAVANSDRILYGSVKSNYSGVHATDLAKVDSTNDKLDKELVSLLRRIAIDASPAITPYMDDEGGEWFMLFAGTRPFRDLKIDLASTLSSADLRGMTRDMSGNALARAGDLIWDGVIIREVPGLTLHTASGAGTPAIDTQQIHLCGQQAIGMALAKRPTPVAEDRDYGDKFGAEIHYIVGVEKLMNNSVQNGVATAFVAAVADS